MNEAGAEHLVNQASPPLVKIHLFRSLFRGREDVYPVRFENRRTGKSGYSSVCANEWVRGVCEKPRVKCAKCSNRRLLPVTLANTLRSWAEPIACMWRFSKNNGITEGFHRKMKLIQRRAYGFRNFDNYRLRVIAQCG